MQLRTYEQYNNFLRAVHDKEESAFDAAEADRLQMALEEAEAPLNKEDGEKLSIDDIQDIYMQVKGRSREIRNMSLKTTSKTGEINDYLEMRRPFGGAEHNVWSSLYHLITTCKLDKGPARLTSLPSI